MSKVSVSRLRRIARCVAWSGAGIVVIAAVAITSIHIEQRVLRWRAERLLGDIRAIGLRQTDWSTAQSLMKRWGKWGRYEGSCTEEHCVYRVELQDFSYLHLNLFGERPPVWMLYQKIGGRPSRVRAEWKVWEGRIVGKSFGVVVEVPSRSGQSPGNEEIGYSLWGSSQSISRFPFQYRPQLLLHPNYVIGTPGGCEICLYVYVQFTPDAGPEDVQRLMIFNLNCLNAWHPCRERDDIMPTAWKQYLAELPRWQEDRRVFQNCTVYPLELMGRDSESAAIGEVVSTYNKTVFDEPLRVARVKLMERLKGALTWQPGTAQEMNIAKRAPYQDGERDRTELLPGQRYVFLMEDRTRGPAAQFEVEPCGVIPAIDDNLKAIRRGIALDYFAAERVAK